MQDVMTPQFLETTAQPQRFFSILPADWRESIVPFWPRYNGTARIFILESDGQTLAGGIVFSSPAPDTLTYREEAIRWFRRGCRYIGFLWVAEAHRGQQLGSLWLRWVRELYPGQCFWLTIDDYKLLPFYERNGFVLEKELAVGGGKEWVLVVRGS